MSFDTPGYVLFLAVTAALYRVSPGRLRPALLLCASLFFYACWSPPLTLVILGVVCLTWVSALTMEKCGTAGPRRLCLAAAVTGCAGLLVWFKYFNFLGSALTGLFGGAWTPRQILLPVGVSFYTFQALSYVIDVYRDHIPAERNPWRYALYICFFPQLVAGPIERADALMPQLKTLPDPTREDTVRGLKLLLTGFFRKLVIADLAAPAVNRVFSAQLPDGSAVLAAALLFAFQIYCDFAGYSEIAMGSAALLGIRLRPNFDRPYLARTVRAFWRRWHMSLTAWFTDYVYIPLGGSRRGRGRQTAAVMLVFLLSGLWHGANWTFVLWGLWHGLLCAAEILLGRAERKADAPPGVRAAQWLLTFGPVLLSWLLFRAGSVEHALLLFRSLFSAWDVGAGLRLVGMDWMTAVCLGLGLAQLPLLHRLSRGGRASEMTYFFLAACALAAWFLRAAADGAGSFIYFQF